MLHMCIYLLIHEFTIIDLIVVAVNLQVRCMHVHIMMHSITLRSNKHDKICV